MLTVLKENNSSYRAKNTDYDGLWKNIIEELFQEFIEFFAPYLYPEIDFSKEADFLKQENHQLIIDKVKGRKFTDQMVKVLMNNGEEKYILVHIEVQAVGKEEFAERMFQYFYRSYDKFDHKIYSIALLTDANHENHTNQFQYSFHGTELTYTYNTYKFYHGE